MFPFVCPLFILIKVPASGPASITHLASLTSSVKANQILACGTLANIKASSSAEVIVTNYPVCPLKVVFNDNALAFVYVAPVAIGL